MKKLYVSLAMVLSFIPFMLFAQDDKTVTIVEESGSDSLKIVTTTVIEKEYVFTNGFWHNWDFTLGIGPHVYLGDNDSKAKTFVERIAFPAIDCYLTKWASPSIGISAGGTVGQFKGLYQSNLNYGNNWLYGANYQTGILYHDADPKWDYLKLAKQEAWYFELFALAHLDLCSAIWGYNPERIYTADAYAGGGVMFGLDKGGMIHSGAFNAGILNKFKITNYIRFILGVRGMLIADDFDGEMYIEEPSMEHREVNINMDGSIGITAGISVVLSQQKSVWRPASRTTEVINRERERVELDTVTLMVKETPQVWFHINFEVDRWELSYKEMVNLHSVAFTMESTPDTRYLICGYADIQTAASEHNLLLSEKRANAVYDFLTEVCGVDPAMLVIDYRGGVDYMFYEDNELSRCVMITSIKE